MPRLAQLTGFSAETLLWGHTAFPYVAAFLSPDKVRQFEAKTLFPEKGTSLSSLTKSITQAVKYRRFCPDCVDADLLKYGETYWHRSHLLPGAHTCLKHGTPLLETRILLRQGHADYRLPQDIAGQRYQGATNASVLFSIARENADALGRRRHREDWSDEYKHAASVLGYQIPSGDIASRQLSEDMRQFYGQSWLTETGCVISTRKQWPAHLVRTKSRIEVAPPKHVLMRVFLKSGNKAGAIVRATPGRKPLDCAQLDKLCYLAVTRFLERLKETGGRITVKDLISRCGNWGHFKHHRDRYPLTNAALLVFRESGLSERQIGRRDYWKKRLGLNNTPP